MFRNKVLGFEINNLESRYNSSIQRSLIGDRKIRPDQVIINRDVQGD